MKFRNEKEIYELVRAFEDRTLTEEEWTHEAHLSVGLFYLVHHAFGVAKNLISDGIYWLNDRHGTPNSDKSGYHETLTVFWLHEIAEFLKANDTIGDIVALANKMLCELCNKERPLKRYTRETLFSVEARRSYVLPDVVEVKAPMFEQQFAFQQS